ncbi:hypothetical protein HBI17_212280 [Parastagonospora nodorum]|nr:hypothetical protein HBI17_212280 [Parastagonospora nodorum]
MLNLRQQRLTASYKRIRGESVYAVFKCLASSSNLSTTIRCANFSSLSRSSSCNYLLYNNSATIVFIYPNANVIVRYSADKYSKKHLKVREADALNNTTTRKTRIKACA